MMGETPKPNDREDWIPEGWFEIGPLIDATKREGLVHEMPCAESVIGLLQGLRPGAKSKSFLTTWNQVGHMNDCTSRACRELRIPIHVSKYIETSAEEFSEILGETRERFGWDRAEEKIVRETQQRLYLLTNENPDAEEIVGKLTRNLMSRRIAAVANIKVPIEIYQKFRFWQSTYYHEGDRGNMSEDEIKIWERGISEFEIRRNALVFEGEQWFDILWDQAERRM